MKTQREYGEILNDFHKPLCKLNSLGDMFFCHDPGEEKIYKEHDLNKNTERLFEFLADRKKSEE